MFKQRWWVPARWALLALDLLQYGGIALVTLPIGLAIWWTATTVLSSKVRP